MKLALNHGLVLRKIHRVIKFNQKAWLKPYIDMTIELRKKEKKWLWERIFKVMNNLVFGKTMENVQKERY